MANVIGISAHFHDAACCLITDGTLVAAAQEERFTRRKHDPAIPRHALEYCLREGGLSITDVDVVAYYEDPVKKLGRQIWGMSPGLPREYDVLARFDPQRPAREIRDLLGYEGPIEYLSHHLAHAASAFLYSGFEEAAILTADGVGEWETTTYGVGRGDDIDLFEAVEFPDSLGLLYSTITGYLGFEVNDGEYKVMGLAPYGVPAYEAEMRTLLEQGPRGQYRLNLRYFDFQARDRMYAPELVELFGHPPRKRGTEVLDVHRNIARSLQALIEDVLLDKAAYLHDRTRCDSLCLAGGVALNCVANGRLLRDGPFRRLFVQPAAGDAGGCLGAAALVSRRLDHRYARPAALDHVFVGPAFDAPDIVGMLQAADVEASDYRGREDDLLAAVADRLARGQVVGWFHGRMEFGPRALGGRSILADPRRPEMQDHINALVKKRESFRPFAPAVLQSRCADHFDLDHASPFMLETCQVRSPLHLPAITHVDGSARVQTVDPAVAPRFARLLEAFERRTDCPILLNTSFNMNDEPIVCAPLDALVCFIRSEIDALVLEDFVIDRAVIRPSARALCRSLRPAGQNAITHRTYTLL